ncbi:MAG: hypothetical protein M0Q90_04235 [Bacteroidales bacterium]|nr:hypothetical protein [Bacteroidales bacterium]
MKKVIFIDKTDMDNVIGGTSESDIITDYIETDEDIQVDGIFGKKTYYMHNNIQRTDRKILGIVIKINAN